MRVLVTGGAGFIGSHVVEVLVAAGHDVRVLDALLPAAWGPDAPPPPYLAGVPLTRGDVRDADTIARCVEDVDVVCHQAAMVGMGVGPDDPLHPTFRHGFRARPPGVSPDPRRRFRNGRS